MKKRNLIALLLTGALAAGFLFPAVALGAGSAEPPSAADEENTGVPETGETPEESGAAPDQPTDSTAGTEAAEEPKKTLEELRDELAAILGETEQTQALTAEIDRIIALGDPGGTLRAYLEGFIRLQQMEYEIQQLRDNLQQLAASDAAIGAIDEAASAIGSADEQLARVKSEIGETAARLLEGAGYDGAGDLSEMASRALAYADGTATGRDLAGIILLTELQDSGLLSETGAVTASDGIRSAVASIASRQDGLSASVRAELESGSQRIAARANGAQTLSPAWIVSAGDSLRLTQPVFTYNGDVMVSLADAAAFMDGQVVEMEDGDTVVIQGPGVVLEMVKGSSDAYLNDKLQKMAQPVLNFDGVCYLPLDTAAACKGMAVLTVENTHLIYPIR